MNEKWEVDIFTPQQYIDAHNAQIRRALLELNSSGRDYYKESFESLELRGDESILNVGSGDGLEEVRWIIEYAHTGPVVALEVPLDREAHENRFYQARQLLDKAAKTNFKTVSGVAEALPFPDNSFEVIVIQHSIYHADWRKALNDAKRVLIDGGKLLITTNGKHNKPRHHYALKKIGRKTGTRAPGPFSAQFNLQRLKMVMPLNFDVLNWVLQDNDDIVLRNEDDAAVYIASVDTYKPSFEPAVQAERWLVARKVTVDTKIENEISRFGEFRDPIERGGGAFINRKKAKRFGRLATKFIAG